MKTINIALFACAVFTLMQFLAPMVWVGYNPFIVGAISTFVVVGLVSMVDNAVKKIIEQTY